MERHPAQIVRSPLEIPPLYVEGYTDKTSYRPGEEVGFHVSTTAANYSMEISRIGATPESVHTESGISGAEYLIPENASGHGCNWPCGFSFKIPDYWKSGYYRVVLRVQDNGGKFVGRNRRTAETSLFFIVRSAHSGRDTKILFQLATNTYAAYNNWGGFGLYFYHGHSGNQGHRVSFHRPMPGQFSAWDAQFIEWAESNGYTLDYAANSDLEFHPEELENYRLVLSLGHDEYWSKGMRDHLEDFIGRGGNAAFFSGNSVCWQVRYEDDGNAMSCWKQWYQMDPVYPTGDHETLTTLWSHYLVNRPENELTGVGFLWGGYHRSHGQLMDGSGAFTVHRPDHWVYEGTGLKRGDEFGGKDTIVGYECDGCEFELVDGLPVPTHRDGTPKTFQILGSAPAIWHPGDSVWYERWEQGRVGAACLGVYTRGGTVFTAGTTDWSHGLRGKDPAVERITHNVLRRLSE